MLLMTATPSTPTTNSIAATAAAVPRGAQMQVAEQALAGLRGRRDSLRAEVKELAQVYREAVDASRSLTSLPQINAVEAQIREVEAQIAATRPRVSEMRLERAGKVAKALDPARRAAAEQARDAIVALNAACEVLSEIANAIRCAGDAGQPMPPTPPTASIQSYVEMFVS